MAREMLAENFKLKLMELELPHSSTHRKIQHIALQIAAYAEALEKRAAYDPTTHELRELKMCLWTPSIDPVHGDIVYKTSCGDAFVFDAGGPLFNGFYHCPYCGLSLTEPNTPEGV